MPRFHEMTPGRDRQIINGDVLTFPGYGCWRADFPAGRGGRCVLVAIDCADDSTQNIATSKEVSRAKSPEMAACGQ